jgi:hypothetical protein
MRVDAAGPTTGACYDIDAGDECQQTSGNRTTGYAAYDEVTLV